MSQYPHLPLVAVKALEALSSWEGINSPTDLIKYLTRNLAVDPNELLQFQDIIYSSTAPSGTSAGKLWVKTDGYPAVGIFVGDSYKLIAAYPFDVPLLWTRAASEFPSYLTKLTESELTKYALTNPEGYFYFMLKSS